MGWLVQFLVLHPVPELLAQVVRFHLAGDLLVYLGLHLPYLKIQFKIVGHFLPFPMRSPFPFSLILLAPG